MRGFSNTVGGVGEENEDQVSRKRENGEDSWAGLLVRAQHRRSKRFSTTQNFFSFFFFNLRWGI